MSFILHLETATKVCSVALSHQGKLIALREISDDSYGHGEQLTLLIEAVLKDGTIAASDLDAVSVSAGPGSYTGLRIGISTAKGMCYALKIPLLSIDALLSMAVLGQQKYPGKTLCPMIDARRMEVYSAIYSSDLSVKKRLSADVLDDSSYSDYEPFVFYGDGAVKIAESWQGRNVLIDTELQPSAAGQITLTYEKFLRNEVEDVAYFEPYYLKEFVGTKPKNLL